MTDIRSEIAEIMESKGLTCNTLAEQSGIIHKNSIRDFIKGRRQMGSDNLEDVLFWLGYELTIEKVDRHKFDVLVDLLVKHDVLAEWLCDEMCDYDVDENGDSWCSKNCSKHCPDNECIAKWVDWIVNV